MHFFEIYGIVAKKSEQKRYVADAEANLYEGALQQPSQICSGASRLITGITAEIGGGSNLWESLGAFLLEQPRASEGEF